MKKLYFLLFIAAATLNTALFAQQSYIKAPAMATTSTNVGAPNGTSAHVTSRGCYLLLANELSVIGTNTAINSIGFYLYNGTSGPAVTGTMQVYLQNTNDASYLKGNSFSAAIAPMTAFSNTIVIPATGASTVFNMTLPSNFTYTGGGLYVAFDWISTGPFAGSGAIYQADNTFTTNAGAYNSSTNTPVNTMLYTNVRPNFQIGYINTYTNEAEVYGILGNGRQPLINGSPYSFSVVVRNNAGVAITNVVPTLSISGANAFVATTTIASIPVGGSVVAAFPSYTPTSQGMNTISVTVPADDNNLNNSGTVAHSVTCNYMNSGPVAPIASFSQGVGFSTNSGLLLNRVRVPNSSTLTALRLGIANYGPNAGNSVYGVVTNSNGSIMATTNTVVITGAMFGTYQTFNFAAPVSMTNTASDYFLGLAQTSNAIAYFPLASMPSPTNNMPANIYGTSWLGGGFVSAQTPTLGWFAIEGVYYNGITLTVTPATSTICSGNTLSITASGATNYTWSTGASGSSISVTPNVYTVYTATGTTIMGTVGTCEDIKTSIVVVNLTPNIVVPNGAICPVGGSFTLNPAGAATYTFSGGGPVVSPTVTSNYTVTGTSAAGCPGNTVVPTVSVQPNITVAITGPTLVCSGQQATLIASGAATYSWNIGSSSNSIIVVPVTTTNYSVLGTFGTCTNNAVATVSASPQLTVTAYATPTTICVGNTGMLVAFGSVGAGLTTYSWSTGATTQSISVSPSVTTIYTVSGISSGVCSSNTTVTQFVDPCIGIEKHAYATPEISIFPNPNNGLFAIAISSITDNSVIELYSSLGQLVLKQKITETNTNINLNTLSKGVYIVRLKENNIAVKTARMIIQ